MVEKHHRVLLAEDHKILRDGIKSLLTEEPDLEVVCEAEDGRTAIRQALTDSPILS